MAVDTIRCVDGNEGASVGETCGGGGSWRDEVWRSRRGRGGRCREARDVAAREGRCGGGGSNVGKESVVK